MVSNNNKYLTLFDRHMRNRFFKHFLTNHITSIKHETKGTQQYAKAV